MASKKTIIEGGTLLRNIKPIKSATPQEARKNVLACYKMWMKRMPIILHHYVQVRQSHYEVRLAFKRLVYLILKLPKVRPSLIFF